MEGSDLPEPKEQGGAGNFTYMLKIANSTHNSAVLLKFVRWLTM
jgi:hypothetical protein